MLCNCLASKSTYNHFWQVTVCWGRSCKSYSKYRGPYSLQFQLILKHLVRGQYLQKRVKQAAYVTSSAPPFKSHDCTAYSVKMVSHSIFPWLTKFTCNQIPLKMNSLILVWKWPTAVDTALGMIRRASTGRRNIQHHIHNRTACCYGLSAEELYGLLHFQQTNCA
jgi:hypothetical protein